MGFDYFVFSWAPYNLKQKLREEKKLEFEWEIDQSNKLITHLTYDMYWSPQGFEFDDYFQDPFIIDDKWFVNSYNLETWIAEFVKQIEEWADHYSTS